MKFVFVFCIIFFAKKVECNICENYVNNLLSDLTFVGVKDIFSKEYIAIAIISEEMCKKSRYVLTKIFGEIPVCQYGRKNEFLEEAKHKARRAERSWCHLSRKIIEIF